MIKLRWATWVAVTAVCVATGALVARLPEGTITTPAGALTWIAAIGLGVIAWFTLRRRSAVGLVLIYGFIGFGAAAALLYRPTSIDLNGANAAVAHLAQQTAGDHYLVTFVAAAFAIWVASLAISVLFPVRHERFLISTALHLPPGVLLVAMLPLIAKAYGTGFHTVFHAERYLEHTGPAVAFRLGQALGPVGVLICGYFTFHRGQPLTIRACALILALTYEMMYLATATRSFALWVPLMFAGGLLTGTWSTSRQQIGLVVTTIVAIIALEVPLGLRNLPNHGLSPSIDYLVHQPSLVFGSRNPINNFLFGAPLTLYVAHNVGRLPISDVVTSVSPLPSQFNNWSQIAPSLRVNIYTPYSALGEVLNHGWVFFLALMALFGAGFSMIERIALRRSGLVGGLSQIIVFGTAVLFVVESTEYNLRSVARLVYYAFFGVILLAVIQALSQSRALNRKGVSEGVSIRAYNGMGHYDAL